MRKKRIRDIAFLSVGIGIGSAIALLLAPGSGEDVRYTLGRAEAVSRETGRMPTRA